MKAFCISDNTDTQMGLRLAGIESIVLHRKEDVLYHLKKLIKDPEICIVLLTTKIVNLCPEEISNYKLSLKNTLVVEIPDRHFKGDVGKTIDSYISQAIGIKL